jgi:hypothetical protein
MQAWAVQSGAAVIPSSRSAAHISELFSHQKNQHFGGDPARARASGEHSPLGIILTSEEMALVDALDGTLCNGDAWTCSGQEQPY